MSLQTTIKWRDRSEPIPDEKDGFYLTYLTVCGSGLVGTAHDKGERPVIERYNYYRERGRDGKLVNPPLPEWVTEYALSEDIVTSRVPQDQKGGEGCPHGYASKIVCAQCVAPGAAGAGAGAAWNPMNLTPPEHKVVVVAMKAGNTEFWHFAPRMESAPYWKDDLGRAANPHDALGWFQPPEWAWDDAGNLLHPVEPAAQERNPIERSPEECRYCGGRGHLLKSVGGPMHKHQCGFCLGSGRAPLASHPIPPAPDSEGLKDALWYANLLRKTKGLDPSEIYSEDERRLVFLACEVERLRAAPHPIETEGAGTRNGPFAFEHFEYTCKDLEYIKSIFEKQGKGDSNLVELLRRDLKWLYELNAALPLPRAPLPQEAPTTKGA